MRHLPQLDIRTWRREPRRFAEQLRAACHHFGFFTLRHDLPSGLAERQLREAARFFSLPRHEKLAVDYGGSAAFRGYMSVGVENTAGRPDVREQLEIAVEGSPAPADAWPPYERLRGPNQWPAAQPGLRPVVEDYARELSRISAEVTRALCAALGLEGDEALRPWFDEPHWQLKIASYPPATAEAAEADGASPRLGVGAHTDSGFLTLLLQDGVGGLQAFSRGEWIDVPPAGPDVLVCNLGELTELVTRGYLLATPHRVVCRPSGAPCTTEGASPARASRPCWSACAARPRAGCCCAVSGTCAAG